MDDSEVRLRAIVSKPQLRVWQTKILDVILKGKATNLLRSLKGFKKESIACTIPSQYQKKCKYIFANILMRTEYTREYEGRCLIVSTMVLIK